jgi:hypothetical protein
MIGNLLQNTGSTIHALFRVMKGFWHALITFHLLSGQNQHVFSPVTNGGGNAGQ